MAYGKTTYTHQDLKAFHDKDKLIVKQVCLNAVASINEGNKDITSEQMTAKAQELLKWFYPNGEQYHCGDKACTVCNKDPLPF